MEFIESPAFTRHLSQYLEAPCKLSWKPGHPGGNWESEERGECDHAKRTTPSKTLLKPKMHHTRTVILRSSCRVPMATTQIFGPRVMLMLSSDMMARSIMIFPS